MVGKRDDKPDIVNAIVLETGYTKRNVEDVVDAFLAVFQEKISDGPVYIKGFGEMQGVMAKRKYFDINQRVMDETVQPAVRFKPTTSFLRLVRMSQKHKDKSVGIDHAKEERRNPLRRIL